MTMVAQLEMTTSPVDLYAATSITPNTQVRLQNVGNYPIRVFSGAAPPGDSTIYFILDRYANEFYQDVEIYVWSEVAGAKLQVEHS